MCSSEILSVGMQLGLDWDYAYDESFWGNRKDFCAQADLQVSDSKAEKGTDLFST